MGVYVRRQLAEREDPPAEFRPVISRSRISPCGGGRSAEREASPAIRSKSQQLSIPGDTGPVVELPDALQLFSRFGDANGTHHLPDRDARVV